MKYAILIYETEEDFAKRQHPEHAGPYWGAYSAYGEALGKGGVAAGGAGLNSHATATTLRLRDGKRHVQDGPYASTKEQLGGFFIVDVPDLDTALDWAARCPGAPTGVIEVRPLLEMPG